MNYGRALLERLGLFAHKAAHVDPQFDLRLQRIGAREQAREAQTGPASGTAAAQSAVRNPHARRAV